MASARRCTGDTPPFPSAVLEALIQGLAWHQRAAASAAAPRWQALATAMGADVGAVDAIDANP